MCVCVCACVCVCVQYNKKNHRFQALPVEVAYESLIRHWSKAYEALSKPPKSSTLPLSACDATHTYTHAHTASWYHWALSLPSSFSHLAAHARASVLRTGMRRLSVCVCVCVCVTVTLLGQSAEENPLDALASTDPSGTSDTLGPLPNDRHMTHQGSMGASAFAIAGGKEKKPSAYKRFKSVFSFSGSKDRSPPTSPDNKKGRSPVSSPAMLKS